MRTIPYAGDRVASAMAEFNIHLSPPLTPPSTILASPPPQCNSQKCPWWPYSSAKDFKVNTALILVVLFCALIGALAFNAAIRYFIRVHFRRRNQQTTANEKEEPRCFSAEAAMEIPSLIYSDDVKSKVAETECIICLSEFAIGDKLRVLDKCSHGFHLHCIQKWLISHSSCPTCRTNCSTDSTTSAPS